MTDVIKIARDRRTRLAAEVAKLDDFIRMAEALVEWSQSKAGKTLETEDEKVLGSGERAGARPFAAADAKA